MKESELKAIVKSVLKEIYQEPQEERGLFGLFKSLAKKIEQGHPEITDISKGHAMAHKFVSAIIEDIKFMIKATVNNKKEDFSKGVQIFEHHTNNFIGFMINWAQQINHECPTTTEQLDRQMNEFKDHLNQVGAQFKETFMNLKVKNDIGKKNVINSLKQLEHLNEIFGRLRESIDNIFQIGLNAGYGKKK